MSRQPRLPEKLNGPRSRRAFAEAQKRIPGGVNSPVRAYARFGGEPPVIAHGHGAWIEDLDGRRYVDYVLSWGPLIAGHAAPGVVKAVQEAASRGLGYGAPTAAETALADLVCGAFPGMERLRLVNSGTEATMSALRLARAATGRDLIIKCEGCYHGHADHLLVAAGSGAATGGHPDSAGVPAAFAALTEVVPYNDATAIERVLKKHRRKVAAVILEPVAGNMGFVPPRPGYLEAVRQACDAAGTLLIFDEVMTGFRVGWGGYQNICGVQPDLTCLGKVIGGGLPLGAYGGRADLFDHLAPNGPCYQAGTLSGNPVAVAAGLATLRIARRKGTYERLAAKIDLLIADFRQAAAEYQVPLQIDRIGSMWGWFFNDQPVTDFASASSSNEAQWAAFTRAMIAGGVNLAPSPFEAAFISTAHDREALRHTVSAARDAFAAAGQS